MFKEEFIQMKDEKFCKAENKHVMKDFTYPSELFSTAQMAQNECKLYCATNENCFGCSNDCEHNCRWTALKDCENHHSSTNMLNTTLLRKPGTI